MAKQGIALNAFGDEKWIGSLYYIKNIAFELAQNEELSKRFNIYVYTTDNMSYVFDELGDIVNVVKVKNKTKWDKIRRIMDYKVKNIRYAFPMQIDMKKIGICSIAWIADFQHKKMPEMFQTDELKVRDGIHENIIRMGIPLVLSSKDAKQDFEAFYPEHKNDVYVVHFVSYIEDIIKPISRQKELQVLNEMGLKEQRYACLMNQFWKHKNHKVVLEAIKIIKMKEPDFDFKFVLTGQLYDYRNPDYISSIRELLDDPIIRENVVLLGFIDRERQIIIMKNAKFVIQPSLFEGWGTVVEDAKVLDKTILLSDISVHREQVSDKSILFDPYDAFDLATKIEIEIRKEHDDDVQLGLFRMYEDAKRYSLNFSKLINEH